MIADDTTAHLAWRTPEALLELGLGRSRVIRVNEAHHGDLRCRRMREVGRRLLPVAHGSGVRYLALEALLNTGQLREWTQQANRTRAVAPPLGPGGYLSQPDMRTLIQEAFDLGWTLLVYEDNFDQRLLEFKGRTDEDPAAVDWHPRIEWREQEQAQNLATHFAALPAQAKLLVWCGWDHLVKVPLLGRAWMACRVARLSRIEPFCMDQTKTVSLGPDHAPFREVLSVVTPQLETLGGTAGLLADEAAAVPGMADLAERADAFVFSLHNNLE